MAKYRLPGCCALCDAEIYEVKTRWPAGHPFAGEAREMGKPDPNAFRVTLALMSGKTADVTVCENCVEDVNDNLVQLWARISNRFGIEYHARPHLGGRPLTHDQRVFAARDLLRTLDDVPLGVIARTRIGQ